MQYGGSIHPNGLQCIRHNLENPSTDLRPVQKPVIMGFPNHEAASGSGVKTGSGCAAARCHYLIYGSCSHW